MMDVCVSGLPRDIELLTRSNGWQRRFRFSGQAVPGAIRLTVADAAADRPFSVSRADGVFISTYESDNICRYAEIGKGFYLAVCGMLGLVQWRALIMNELLVWEDFFVEEEPRGCLYAARDTIQEYALAFEEPYVCDACMEFFRCLGAEPEIMALQDILSSGMPAQRL